MNNNSNGSSEVKRKSRNWRPPINPFFRRDENGELYLDHNGNSLPSDETVKECIELLEDFLEVTDEQKRIYELERQAHISEKRREYQRTKPEKRNSRKNTAGYVYIYQQNDYYKIGRSKDRDCRKKKYVTENPEPVQLVYRQKTDNYKEAEKALHEAFSDKRHNREWFKLEESDIERAEEIISKYKAER